MKPRIIAAAELDRLVGEWTKDAAVYAPVTVKDWTEYRRITSLREADLGRVNTKVPVKTLLFPQAETMFRFHADNPASAEPGPEPQAQLILGVRPCDAAAIAVLDKFFTQQGETDTYYRARRDKTVLVGLACNATADTCFCAAVGGSPTATRGLDLLLTDLGERYLAEPVTAKGEALVADLPEAAADDLERKRELAAEAAAGIALELDPAALKKRLDTGFEDPVWETLCRPCVNCGACTFLCPTCHCFDVTDETCKGQGARIRVWDSCQFCVYSQHASGHNPRATTRSRYRNRVMDKFKYTVDMIGELSCVGCGRCVIECPAGIDVRETAEILMTTLLEGKK
jgi:sulfhydrogenase subunit beta (sulfur reductase)